MARDVRQIGAQPEESVPGKSKPKIPKAARP